MKKISRYNSIGREELLAATKVIKSGILSNYIGAKGKNFTGGKEVLNFEKNIKNFFSVKFAVSVNSWTSGLICAVGAINPEPGQEIICTPWTMCACATSILHWNCIPIFVDIDMNTFNFDLDDLKKKITKKTKAIIAVDIFGQSENIYELKKIVKGKNIKIISDTAQAIGSKYKNKYSGTLTDIGGFSFNYHKHINTGEGGVIITNNAGYAKRCRLIRNHGEAVVAKNSSKKELSNILGYNFRLGEIEAAIGNQQIKKLNKIIKFRQLLAHTLTDSLRNLKGLKVPFIKKNCTHVYYIIPFVLNLKELKYSRKEIIKRLKSLNIIGLAEGYSNLHLLPVFKKKIAYGTKGFPWNLRRMKTEYKKGMCKNAEELHEKTFFYLSICAYDYSIKDMRSYAQKFKKVWKEVTK